MAGLNDRFKMDLCQIRADENISIDSSNFVMNPINVTRPHQANCETTFGTNCNQGAVGPSRVHLESFLSRGLGRSASDCPGGPYRPIPDGAFVEPGQSLHALNKQRCQSAPFLLDTRQRASTGPLPNIRELTFTQNLLPGAWMGDYAGINSLGNLRGAYGSNYYMAVSTRADNFSTFTKVKLIVSFYTGFARDGQTKLES